jgi:galactokinase
VRTLASEGVPVEGVRGTIRSDIPVGAGLSSSAALEVAIALAVSGGRMPDPAMLARAEQLATGVPCGVMDQTTVLNARSDHAILLDCSTREFEQIPIHPRVGFVVIDTGTRRELADGRYAERRAEVEDAFAATGASRLGELDPAAVGDRRLRHAVSENARVLDAVPALRSGDVDGLGALVSASHASLRDDFEVSSPELDRAVEVVSDHPACTGARLVGAGFAGCVIAVTRASAAENVAAHVVNRLPSCSAVGVSAVDHAGEA